MAIRFYAWPMSSASRVHWALEELGIPYEYIQPDRAKNEHKGPEYLAINPNAKVPALVDGDETYFESLAIIQHLGERYGVERGLWPKSGADRGDAMSWSAWALVELQKYMMDYAYHGLDTRLSYKPEDRSKAAAEFDLGATKKNFAMIEQRLAGREHILGKFTLVDVIVGSVLRFASMIGISLAEYPNITAYVQRLNQRPAVSRIK